MEQVEPGVGLAGQLYGVLGGLHASLSGAHHMVEPDRDSGGIFLFQGFARRGDYPLALGVAGDDPFE